MNEDGITENFSEKRSRKIFEKIYLSLQEDEIEFSNVIYRDLIKKILDAYLQNGNFDHNEFVNQLDKESEIIIVDILMNEDKYSLDGWLEKKQVFVKSKDDEEVLHSLVIETIISYREYLIQNLTKQILIDFEKSPEDLTLQEVMHTINDYNVLKSTISKSINRVRTDYFK